MYLKMDEYLSGAKKALIKWGGYRYQNDDDAISYVAEKMMWADHNFDGRGSQYGYRGQHARFAVLKWLASEKRRISKHILSLNYDSNNCGELYRTISNKKLDTCTISEYNEVVEVVNRILSGKHLDFFINYFIYGMTLQQVGEEFGFTKQYVSLSIRSSINKIRKYFNED